MAVWKGLGLPLLSRWKNGSPETRKCSDTFSSTASRQKGSLAKTRISTCWDCQFSDCWNVTIINLYCFELLNLWWFFTVVRKYKYTFSTQHVPAIPLGRAITSNFLPQCLYTYFLMHLIYICPNGKVSEGTSLTYLFISSIESKIMPSHTLLSVTR